MKADWPHCSSLIMPAATGGLLPAVTVAQTYPTKPIRILVGFSAGGSTDLVARVAGSRLPAWPRDRPRFMRAAAAQSSESGPSDSSQA